MFVYVKNTVCEDGVCSVYICWWLNNRENRNDPNYIGNE